MFKMNEKAYQVLKWTVILLIPATSVLYASLGKIWGFPYVDQITGTLMALQVFLGTIFGISCATYTPEEKPIAEEKAVVGFEVTPTKKEEYHG